MYQAIKESKGHTYKEEDKRLEVRQTKKSNEPKELSKDVIPAIPGDAPMEISTSDIEELPAETSEIGGADVEIDLDDAMGPVDDEPEDHAMIAMMDVLQTLGVEANEANRFSSRIMRVSNQPLNPTFVEMYGCGNRVQAANHILRNLNVEGLAAIDLRTSKPNGEAWDSSRKSDRTKALRYVQDKKPTWIVGSPPCTAFSRLQGLNFPKTDPDKVARMLKEAKAHLHSVISLYHIQIANGRHVLHEHPVGATSWNDHRMLRLLRNPKVDTTAADECMYGLTTMDKEGKRVKAKKPTKWASTSKHMLARLSQRCDGSHSHQHLVGGKAAAAAYYSPKFISQMLRGMRDTADAGHVGPYVQWR